MTLHGVAFESAAWVAARTSRFDSTSLGKRVTTARVADIVRSHRYVSALLHIRRKRHELLLQERNSSYACCYVVEHHSPACALAQQPRLATRTLLGGSDEPLGGRAPRLAQRKPHRSDIGIPRSHRVTNAALHLFSTGSGSAP